MLFDSHAHVQFRGFDDRRESVLTRSKEKGMIINLVGTQKETSAEAVALAEQHDWLYASIGTHPNHLFPTHVDQNESEGMTPEKEFDVAFYSKLAASKKVIAVGECGLDLFHLPSDVSKEEVLKAQTQMFIAHAEFAFAHTLPLVIHCREAHDEMIAILKSFNRQIQGTVHCYTGNWAHAQEYLKLGLHLGFTGVVTFPPKKTNPTSQLALQEVIEKMPLDRMLVETDAPYLAPQAYRGEKSEPWMVEEVVKHLATSRGLSFEDMKRQISENSVKLFSRVQL